MLVAVVFGKVEEGMPLVRRLESCGSRSGKTMKPITVADCGELPSRRQILSKMAAEREENANLKKDPLQVGQAAATLPWTVVVRVVNCLDSRFAMMKKPHNRQRFHKVHLQAWCSSPAVDDSSRH